MNFISEIFTSISMLLDTEAKDAKVMARVAEAQRQRLAEMATDPIRSKYVERIQRGEYWRDEEILFNEDPNATNVCEHLRGIEHLMRLQKIDLRPSMPLYVKANCLVNYEKLRLELDVPESVGYSEPHIPDRSMLDPRSAWFMCGTCTSTIEVVHLDVAKPDTPWFPR